MKNRLNVVLFSLLLLEFSIIQVLAQKEFTTCLYALSRNRIIPIAVYQPPKEAPETKVIIFNHGYDDACCNRISFVDQ